jgi:putative membrane protein
MVRNTILVASVALLAVPFGARAEDKPVAVLFDDATFVKGVAVGGMFEVYLSELTGPQTRNGDVKKFAVLVVTNHFVAKEELKSAAEAAGIELPTKLDDAHKKQYDAFKECKGATLDRDYAKAMVKCHTDGVAAFRIASKLAKNPAVKEFATKTLPTLQKHLEMAKALEK